MKYKKIIAAILCVSLVLSSVGTVFAAMTDGKLGNIRIPFVSKYKEIQPPKFETNTEEAKKIATDIAPKPAEKVKKISLPKNKGESVIYSSERTVLEGDEAPKDIFNVTKEDIEVLLAEGHSMEDILMADDIGNRNFIDPKLLLEHKKKTNKSLADIEKNIVKERKEIAFGKLKEKHKNEYEVLASSGLSEDEQLTLLSIYDTDETQSINTLVDDYKKNSKEVIEKYMKKEKKQ